MMMTALRALISARVQAEEMTPRPAAAMQCDAMRCDAESTLSTDPDWPFGLVVVSKPGYRLVENGERASFFRETL